METPALQPTFCLLGSDIVRQRFKQMLAERAAVLEDRDPEALHDMRVAARRLRIALDAFADCAGPATTERLARQTRRLQRALGRVRDLDVLLERLSADLRAAPLDQRVGIAWLIDQKRQQRATQFQQMRRRLRKANVASIRANFQALLASYSLTQPSPETTAATPISHLLRARLAELLTWSQPAQEPTHAREQHELRIAAKRLRYTLELFQDRLPAPAKDFIQPLSDLQDKLGALHDQDVLLSLLRDILAQPQPQPEQAAEDRPTSEVLIALEGFLTDQLGERAERYHTFCRCWEQWKAQGLEARLSGLIEWLSPQPTPEEQRRTGGLGVEDWPHARQVARLARLLFDATQPLHRLDRRAALLLDRAALLHNAGILIETKRHHTHSFALISATPLPDVSEAERHEIACIARYHRRALPALRHPEFAQLDEAARRRVSQLAALLRIADALDERHDGRVASVTVEIKPERVSFFITTFSAQEATSERSFAQEKADLFETVFERKARFVEKQHV